MGKVVRTTNKIPRTNIVFNYWNPQAPDCFIRFMTSINFQTDPCLEYIANSNYKIYTSEFNKWYLTTYHHIREERIVPLEFGKPLKIYDPDKKQTFEVSALNANFCVGSIMLLFQGPFGNILYTGAFRISSSTDLWNVPVMKKIIKEESMHCVYFDNCFAAEHCDFPSRDEVVGRIVNLLRKYPDHKVFIFGKRLGREEVLCDIAAALNEKICVSKEKFILLERLGFRDRFTILENNRITALDHIFKVPECKKINRKQSPCLFILLTASHAISNSEKLLQKETPNLHIFPYSGHCCHKELMYFFTKIRPHEIRPIILDKLENDSNVIPECMFNLRKRPNEKRDLSFENQSTFNVATIENTSVVQQNYTENLSADISKHSSMELQTENPSIKPALENNLTHDTKVTEDASHVEPRNEVTDLVPIETEGIQEIGFSDSPMSFKSDCIEMFGDDDCVEMINGTKIDPLSAQENEDNTTAGEIWYSIPRNEAEPSHTSAMTDLSMRAETECDVDNVDVASMSTERRESSEFEFDAEDETDLLQNEVSVRIPRLPQFGFTSDLITEELRNVTEDRLNNYSNLGNEPSNLIKEKTQTSPVNNKVNRCCSSVPIQSPSFNNNDLVRRSSPLLNLSADSVRATKRKYWSISDNNDSDNDVEYIVNVNKSSESIDSCRRYTSNNQILRKKLNLDENMVENRFQNRNSSISKLEVSENMEISKGSSSSLRNKCSPRFQSTQNGSVPLGKRFRDKRIRLSQHSPVLKSSRNEKELTDKLQPMPNSNSLFRNSSRSVPQVLFPPAVKNLTEKSSPMTALKSFYHKSHKFCKMNSNDSPSEKNICPVSIVSSPNKNNKKQLERPSLTSQENYTPEQPENSNILCELPSRNNDVNESVASVTYNSSIEEARSEPAEMADKTDRFRKSKKNETKVLLRESMSRVYQWFMLKNVGFGTEDFDGHNILLHPCYKDT